MPDLPAPDPDFWTRHMDPPLCRTCGKKHWSRVCDGDEGVTKRDVVTATVTPLREADLEVDNRRLIAEVARLTEEVAQLKRQLAGANKDAPMTSAERQRRYRERRRLAGTT